MVMMGIGSVLSMTSMGNTSTSDHNPPTSLTCKLIVQPNVLITTDGGFEAAGLVVPKSHAYATGGSVRQVLLTRDRPHASKPSPVTPRHSSSGSFVDTFPFDRGACWPPSRCAGGLVNDVAEEVTHGEFEAVLPVSVEREKPDVLTGWPPPASTRVSRVSTTVPGRRERRQHVRSSKAFDNTSNSSSTVSSRPSPSRSEVVTFPVSIVAGAVIRAASRSMVPVG